MNNDQQITYESPYDVMRVYELPDGIGGTRPAPVYRSHYDAIEAYSKRRKVPDATTLAILRNDLVGAVNSCLTARDLDGLVGATLHAANTVKPELWGSVDRVAEHLRSKGNELTASSGEV